MTSLRKWWNNWWHRASRTVPSNRLIALILVLAGLNFLLANWLLSQPWFWIGLTGVLLVAAIYDLVGLSRLRLTAERQVPVRPQLQVPFALDGVVTYAPSFLKIAGVDVGLTGSLAAQSPLHWLSSDKPSPEAVSPDSAQSTSLQFTQSVLPIRRGKQTVAALECKVRSRWGLWQRLDRVGEPEEVLIVPDLTSWRKEVAALQQTLSQEGTHLRRLHSGDSEFSHLADYVPDDDPRRINWAASARRRRLMKNVYQEEQGQQLIVAVDASRYMQVAFRNGKTRLDYALECAAALASSALHTGDRVGVLAFTHQMLFQLPPRRGPNHWRLIVENLAALEAQPVQGGYETLLRHLRGSFHRRSLLAIVSELEGVESDPGFLRILGKVQRQHPTLFITQTDTEARRQMRETPNKTSDIPKIAAAHWILEERDRARRDLQRQGVSLVESLPGELAVEAVSAYLQRRLRFTR